DARFIAVLLPNGVQTDEDDAQRARAFVRAVVELTVNVKPAADAMLAAMAASGHAFETPAQQDFVHGNVKARERMIAQYAVAGARRGIVIGTDHAAESLMGFFTKFGDGGAAILPLAGLNKPRVRAVARSPGGYELHVMQVPTAYRVELRPLRPDEHPYGVPSDQTDDFLQ
ncbi:NAD(+) synthase, partial [Pseudomonas sp. MWU13-2625]